MVTERTFSVMATSRNRVLVASGNFWTTGFLMETQGRLEFLGYRQKRIRLMKKICLLLGYLYPFLFLATVGVS